LLFCGRVVLFFFFALSPFSCPVTPFMVLLGLPTITRESYKDLAVLTRLPFLLFPPAHFDFFGGPLRARPPWRGTESLPFFPFRPSHTTSPPPPYFELLMDSFRPCPFFAPVLDILDFFFPVSPSYSVMAFEGQSPLLFPCVLSSMRVMNGGPLLSRALCSDLWNVQSFDFLFVFGPG